MNIIYYITEDTFSQKACIIPSANEDPDILHNIAIQLPHITNPCIIFSEEVKEGKYDELSDDEYDLQIYVCKELGKLWNDSETGKGARSITIFELLVRLLDIYIENARFEYFSVKKNICTSYLPLS